MEGLGEGVRGGQGFGGVGGKAGGLGVGDVHLKLLLFYYHWFGELLGAYEAGGVGSGVGGVGAG